jgi:hypothetical protein
VKARIPLNKEALIAEVEALEAHVDRLEKQAVVWHKYPNTKPFNSEEYLVISCGKYVIATWDFYAGRFIANDEFLDDVANWAYLPEPPDIACDAHIGKSATQAPLPVSGATQAEVDND